MGHVNQCPRILVKEIKKRNFKIKVILFMLLRVDNTNSNVILIIFHSLTSVPGVPVNITHK